MPSPTRPASREKSSSSSSKKKKKKKAGGKARSTSPGPSEKRAQSPAAGAAAKKSKKKKAGGKAGSVSPGPSEKRAQSPAAGAAAKKNKKKEAKDEALRGRTAARAPGPGKKLKKKSKSPDEKGAKKKNKNKNKNKGDVKGAARSKSPDGKKSKAKKKKTKKKTKKKDDDDDDDEDETAAASVEKDNADLHTADPDGLLEAYPVGARVQALYPADLQWYDGTVSGHTSGDVCIPLVTFDGFESAPPEPCPKDHIRLLETEEEALLRLAAELAEAEAAAKAAEEAEAERVRLEVEAAKLLPIPIPQISVGERLGPFGLEQLALAGLDAVVRRDISRIHEYLKQASRAENGRDAAVIATGETPFMRVCETGDTELFHIFVSSKCLKPNFNRCINRVGLSALMLMMLHGRIDFVFLLLTQYRDVNVDWTQSLRAEACKGIDSLTGARCGHVAKEEHFSHEIADHVREMIALRRERQARRQEGLVEFTLAELDEKRYGAKLDKLRFAKDAASVAAACGYHQIGELLEGFDGGSCEDLLAAFDGIDRLAAKALGGCGKSGAEAQRKWATTLRFEVLTAMRVLEDVLKKGTWENAAKFGNAGETDGDEPTIIENMQFWRQCMLCDGRFRCRRTRKPLAGVVGLETVLGGQLNDYFARIRLCFPDGLWKMRCERAWLRIYYCVTDVYRVHSPQELEPQSVDDVLASDNAATTVLSALDRIQAADETAEVEFYSDSWGCWTEPMTFF